MVLGSDAIQNNLFAKDRHCAHDTIYAIVCVCVRVWRRESVRDVSWTTVGFVNRFRTIVPSQLFMELFYAPPMQQTSRNRMEKTEMIQFSQLNESMNSYTVIWIEIWFAWNWIVCFSGAATWRMLSYKFTRITLELVSSNQMKMEEIFIVWSLAGFNTLVQHKWNKWKEGR